MAASAPGRRRPRRLRVLQTIGTMHIGGAENVVLELARGLDPERFEVEVCCTKERGVVAELLASEGVPVALAAPPSRRLRHLTPLYLHREIQRFQADVVHTHGTPSLLHVAPLALLGRSPRWVHTFHYGRYDQARGRQFDFEGRFCRIASNLIAVSEAQRRAIIARYALDPLRIATIPNGVRFTAPTPAQVAQHRTELGLSASDTVVGCIAVLSEQKGVAYLLEAARNLAPRYPDLRFLIVGGGPLEAHLRQQASELGLGSRIVFAGWRTDAAQFLPLFDVWVMASLWEAMPMALMEAMAAGIPIVATDVGDNRSIVADGRCAVLIPPASAGAIEGAVSSLLDQPEQARAMAGRAAARYRDAFTTAHMVAHYERLFEGR